MNHNTLTRIIKEEVQKKLREGLGPDLEQKIMDVLMSTSNSQRMGPDRLARTAKDLAMIMQGDPEFQKNWFRAFKPSYDQDIRGNFNADEEDF